MAHMHPYLKFKGNYRDAMNFYKECFGGNLELQTVGEMPGAQPSAEGNNNVMHSSLATENFTIMASDMFGEDAFNIGTVISLCLICKDKAEAEDHFAKLSQGGKITTPLVEEFFGMYGELTDKFGIKWMFQSDMPKA